jgi:hypothetical protein
MCSLPEEPFPAERRPLADVPVEDEVPLVVVCFFLGMVRFSRSIEDNFARATRARRIA